MPLMTQIQKVGMYFLYMLIAWIAFLGIYSFVSFDFFGEEWKKQND